MPDPDEVAAVGAERAEATLFPQSELLGLPDLPYGRAVRIEERRRAGRPAGSRNKRVEDAARFVVEHFGDPLLHQVAVATMDVEELAGRLRCTALEAMVEKRLAAATVLPYLHRRQPLAVDVTNHKLVHLTIVSGGAATVQPLEGQAAAIVLDRVEYQQVSEGGDAPV